MLRTSSELVDAFEPYISHNYIDSSKSARTGYLTDGHQTMEILHEQRR
ncbi:hypothetical protein ACO22_04024 [Paracoccidioides brasiliensis]|uniref:Uncharacterized protein n=1 Tax=Paracoccidioides brasiliensis TaxID=121759 RepID=A0A1D2JE90_PARBR|nr:hypothetical protein ACO22_04024 [Paracoccidioides brasiliensis]